MPWACRKSPRSPERHQKRTQRSLQSWSCQASWTSISRRQCEYSQALQVLTPYSIMNTWPERAERKGAFSPKLPQTVMLGSSILFLEIHVVSLQQSCMECCKFHAVCVKFSYMMIPGIFQVQVQGPSPTIWSLNSQQYIQTRFPKPRATLTSCTLEVSFQVCPAPLYQPHAFSPCQDKNCYTTSTCDTSWWCCHNAHVMHRHRKDINLTC